MNQNDFYEEFVYFDGNDEDTDRITGRGIYDLRDDSMIEDDIEDV